jgi:hypothetical protein
MHDGEFEPTNLLDQFSSLCIVSLDIGEVAANPVFQIFSFTYIYNGIGRIEIAVHAGFFR